MTRFLVTLIFMLSAFCLMAQEFEGYLGAGYSKDIQVTSSSAFAPDYWEQTADGNKTVDGSGMDFHLLDASRFLAQATLGAEFFRIEEAADQEFEDWINHQFALPASGMLDELQAVFQEVNDWWIATGGDSAELNTRPYWTHFNYAWWNLNMTNEDKLRHRIALALSEILVISINSDLESHGWGLASYYDLLVNHAFGNYRNLLRDVTLHPCMGFYLSHLNNPREIPQENIHPDENYAREIMQLFSIGLYMLNQDGTRQTDNDGNWIPTYGQSEIKEFAKVFTGLGMGGVIPNMYEDEPYFGMGIYLGDLTVPMKIYPEWHQPGSKQLLNGFVVPSGQTGMEDIEDAIDNIFAHPNVGPFLAKQLIQRLTTSNPSTEYVGRVAAAFNDNGDGVRGDMKAVIKAILLDPEVRACSALTSSTGGKLREPFLRYTHFASAIDKEQFYGRYWNVGYGFMEQTGQTPLGAPTVFNFFLPNFQPLGPISDAALVGPEYQIHNSRTSIGYINEVNRWAVWNSVMNSWEPGDPNTILNLDELRQLARDPEALLNKLDVLLTHGLLSDRTRNIIKSALDGVMYGDFREDRVRLALYLIMISPDYAILK